MEEFFMKSTSLLLLLTVLLCLLGGCSSAEKPAETFVPPVLSAETLLSIPNTPPETEVPELSDEISEDPPPTLYFREIAEYTAFADSPGLPDEEFDRYVRENNYHMNGIRTKEDAAALLAKLDSMTVPVIEQAEAVNITVAMETGYCTVVQQTPADEIYFVRIPLNGTPVSVDTVNKTRLTTDASDEIYHFTNPAHPNHHQYEGFLGGSYIFIWTKTEDKSAADEAVSNLTFTTLADFIH